MSGVCRTSISLKGVWVAEESSLAKPKNGNEECCGTHGAELCWAQHLTEPTISSPPMEFWEITSSEQLHAFSVSKVTGDTVNSSLKSGTEISAVRGIVNRGHLREFIHYESEAIGIDTPGSDLPAYQWDLDTDMSSLYIGPVGVASMNNKHQASNPTASGM